MVIRLYCEFEIARLTELHRALRRQKPGKPLVVVTFDDGHRGTVTDAKPLFERAGIPATIFLIYGIPRKRS